MEEKPVVASYLTVDNLPSVYIEAVMSGNEHLITWALLLFNSFLVNDKQNHPAPEMFEHLLLPLLENDEEILLHMTGVVTWALQVQGPVIRGLQHPDCPASVLSAACRHPNDVYRYAAVKHPNCLVEDQVFVALTAENEDLR